MPVDVSRKVKSDLIIGFLITALMALLMATRLSPIEIIEEKLYDYRFELRGAVAHRDEIVVAAIDEKSLEKLGRWPWSRDKIARLIDKLVQADAEMIVFDVLMSEDEKNDPLLGRAIGKAGNVFLPFFFDFEDETPREQIQFLLGSSLPSIRNQELFNKHSPIRARGVHTPVPDLAKEAMALGHINMIPDGDGTLRWEPMIIEYDGYLYPSIDLQVVARYLGVPPEKVLVRATEGIQIGEKGYVPTDKHGRGLIYYYGPTQTFKYLSIADILEGNIKPDVLQGKIVLIGATASGIYDLRVTPFSPAMPGVEKHANVIASMLERRFLKRASTLSDLGVLVLSGVLFSLLITRTKAVGSTVIAGLFLLLTFTSGYYLFVRYGLWTTIAYPSATVVLILIGVTVYNYAVQERYARRIRAMFSTYVTERVVNELIRNPDTAKLGGERRDVTVLFTDVRGFTALSEKRSPEEVVAILNEYLGAMTEVVFKWEGTLDKFIGDAILAFWGAPLMQENHAELAVKCSLEMVRRLEELQQKWLAEGKPVLDAGIGINSGEVVVGNIGAEGKKMDYTVIGDHVNLGSRVESLTRKYNVHILVTEFTLDKIKDSLSSGKIFRVSVRGLEKVVVKGKEEPVAVYEVTSVGLGVESSITDVKGDDIVHVKEK